MEHKTISDKTVLYITQLVMNTWLHSAVVNETVCKITVQNYKVGDKTLHNIT